MTPGNAGGMLFKSVAGGRRRGPGSVPAYRASEPHRPRGGGRPARIRLSTPRCGVGALQGPARRGDWIVAARVRALLSVHREPYPGSHAHGYPGHRAQGRGAPQDQRALQGADGSRRIAGKGKSGLPTGASRLGPFGGSCQPRTRPHARRACHIIASRPRRPDASTASDRLLDHDRANLQTLKLRSRTALAEADAMEPSARRGRPSADTGPEDSLSQRWPTSSPRG